MKYFTIFLFITLNTLLYFNSALEALKIDFFKELFLILIMLNIIVLTGILNKKLMFAFIILIFPLYISSNLLLIKFITFSLVLYIAYNMMLHYYTTIRKILILILVLNAIFIFIELNGLIDGLDNFQIYYDPVGYQNSLFVENTHFPLYQIRPSGIYHTTIFLTFEMSFTIAILHYGIKSYTLLLIITFLAVFSGSTALFLLLMILPIFAYINNANNRKITLASFIFLFFWLVVYLNMYPSIALYNFDLENYIASFNSRMDFSSTNSTITSNVKSIVIIFILGFLLTALYLIRSNYRVKMRFIYLFLVIISVFLVHDFLDTTKFYINLGILLGYMKIFYSQKVHSPLNSKEQYCRI